MQEYIQKFNFPEEEPTRSTIEESCELKTKYFGKKLLEPVNHIEERMYDINTTREGKSGKFIVKCPGGHLMVSYKVILSEKSPAIEIFFTRDSTRLDGGTSQTIQIETDELPMGRRFYFLCECGKKCKSLFITESYGLFQCRACQKLVYESSKICRRTMGGLQYYIHRLKKLTETREKMDRITYRGMPTKRAARFFRMYAKLDQEYSPIMKEMAKKMSI